MLKFILLLITFVFLFSKFNISFISNNIETKIKYKIGLLKIKNLNLEGVDTLIKFVQTEVIKPKTLKEKYSNFVKSLPFYNYFTAELIHNFVVENIVIEFYLDNDDDLSIYSYVNIWFIYSYISSYIESNFFDCKNEDYILLLKDTNQLIIEFSISINIFKLLIIIVKNQLSNLKVGKNNDRKKPIKRDV